MVMGGRIGRKRVQESAAAAAHMVLIQHMVFELMVVVVELAVELIVSD